MAIYRGASLPRIQQLAPAVITKIAAGEVIERPASVAKELLENSVDAGSTRIDVAVEQGGIECIRVADNGCGIAPEDLPLAFASHATSKLADAEDLFKIGTLGFRGEALASIGGVAQVTLQSRLHDRDSGAQLSCHGGTLSEVRAWNGTPGTCLEVRHLFYNTPVRRKFLRTPGTEMGHLSETFTRLALARPDLHLSLTHNGKAVYELPAGTPLLERLGLFFGAELRDQLYALEAANGQVRLGGYIADPACERGNAKMQYLFVNGRCIRDRGLGHAVQEAYRGLIMTGRYPVVFLFLELPPDLVDVNVHPTKAEVRFREGHALYNLVLSAIRSRLRAENLTARLRAPAPLAAPVIPASPFSSGEDWFRPVPVQTSPQLPLGPPLSSTSTPDRNPPPASPEPARFPPPGEMVTAQQTAGLPAPVPENGSTPRAIQLYNAYLVLETPEGMLVIDQHALHERILFEQLKSRIRTGALESQRLLIPEPIELTAEQAARTLEHQADLALLGLGVEDFGGGTLLITGYPALLGNRSPQVILKAVVDHLATKERVPTREQFLSNLLSLMACHAAVRAGDPLSAEEIAALIAQRNLAEDTHHCPHGRPTALLFSRQELDRQFRRT
jgi:DNA mismatch repair protein MutL